MSDPITPSAAPHVVRPEKELLVAWILLLLHEAGETYGYTLHRGLEAHGIELQATSVYRWLAKFERDRWVAAQWSEPVDGPRRHVYSLTAEGRAALHETTRLIAAMHETYGTFLEAHAQALARRGAGGVDEEATPVLRAVPPAPAAARTGAQVPATEAALRPHRELLVGWILLQLEAGATYGYDLRRAFDARRLSPDPGALYRMLRQLEADKWVQSRWLSPAAGPRRRFYRLTGRGRRHLDDIARLVAALRDAHAVYLDAYERAAEREGLPHVRRA